MTVKEAINLLGYGTAYEIKGAYSGKIYHKSYINSSKNLDKYANMEVTDTPFYTDMRIRGSESNHWCIPVHQKLSPIIGTAGAYGVVAAFFVLYILLSYVPIVALAPGIASVIMLTGLFWAPADHIGNNVVRIIVKGVILLIMVLIEFCVLINATLPWLERKTATPPRVRTIEK